MVEKVVPMNTRLIAAVTSVADGVNITQLCRDHGISTKSFYKWHKRYLEEGIAGLYERSRRPLRTQNLLTSEVGDRIEEIRQNLLESGFDHGPMSIQSKMKSDGDSVVPSTSSIWRILNQRGLIAPQPKKRPKSSYVRFEAGSPNEMWQIDFTEWRLGNGQTVYIINIVDDHSRVAIASVAVAKPTSKEAWKVFSAGVSRWGLPSRCLSDNGLAFSGKLRGIEVYFEKQLRDKGVSPTTARPYHPQTCGKVERFQQTLKRWLRSQDPPQDIDELQRLLERFCLHYNNERPHQSLGRQTPISRWSAIPRATASGEKIRSPVLRGSGTCLNGVMAAHGWLIGVGAEYSNKPGEVLIDGTFAMVFIEGRLIRSLELDTTKAYQPTGRSPGRRTKIS